ncbi:MAG: MBL fold metallo-hydrolase, partial [Thermomicrobiales bacterium]|nr:MBL fold metallo-hydrolase [Thermomicrobiales bacterium]
MDRPDPGMEGFPERVRDARVHEGEIALWYTGGAGYAVRTARATLLIDPFLGPSNPPDWLRAIPPAFAPERIGELGPLDAVLITHEHADHADPVALAAVANGTTAVVYGPASAIAVAEAAGVPGDRCRVVTRDEPFTAGDLRVTPVGIVDPLAEGCAGYVLETGSVTLLHCGDSLYFDGFVDFGTRWTLDALCVSVGNNPPGATLYMDEADAARAARDCRARMLIPQHYDLWQGITLDPRRVREVAGWYTPDTKVAPARLGRRRTV